MAKILYIKANPKEDKDSNTFMLANEFISEYKIHNPDDEIKTLDLYKENIKPLDGEMIVKLFSGQENIMTSYAKEFAETDKYIIAAPMWNLSIPSILKSYIDYITYVGITFKYTSEGPVGLLANKGKKAIHIVSRGGEYEDGPGAQFEMGDRYIRTILGFMGIDDVKTLSFDLTNVLQGEELERQRNKSYNEARKMAKDF